jgi:hypothetical protein
MRTALFAATALFLASAACAQAPASSPATPDPKAAPASCVPAGLGCPAPATLDGRPDYANPAAWVCRPGAEEVCTKDLDALAVDAAGVRTPAPFVAAKDPAIDCFYVYPTVSHQPGRYADMTADPEVIRAAHAQAGRFAAKCRLFAPIYRQLTLAALFSRKPTDAPLSFDPAYEDVRAAWRSYLARDNHGRGVVLIGHSQGTILLQRLLREEIDGKADQKVLVSALLGGNPGFGVPAGKDVGGTLKSIRLCHAKDQTGCVVTWSTYLADDTASPLVFGRSPAPPGQVAACVNPAALGGGRAPVKAYFHKPSVAPAEDPPYVEAVGQMSAECVNDLGGATLRVTIEPGPGAEPLKTLIAHSTIQYPGWGLHLLDFSIPQGDLVDLVGAQSDAWVKGRR